MHINSQDILFFFGAGASKSFGIPTMRDMASEFQKTMVNDTLSEKPKIYNEIIKLLKDDMGSDVDIEAIFSVIEGLKNYNVENIGELSIYSCRRFFKDTFLNKPVPTKATLQNLETSFQRFIRVNCKLKSEYRNKLVEVYSDFFNTIGQIVDAPFNSSIVRHDRNWTLFTTNYDRCLESFWRENVQVELDTGFRHNDGSVSSGDSNSKLQADQFLLTFGSRLQFAKSGSGHFRLVKLHGSVTWLRREHTYEIEEKIFDIDQGFDLGYGSMYVDEVVIYPLRQKQLYLDPYIQMFYLLNKELESKKVWIVIGYSFRDVVIRNVFSTILAKDQSKIMILVDPSAVEVKTKQFPDFNYQTIKVISICFGDSNYKEVNKTIAEYVECIKK